MSNRIIMAYIIIASRYLCYHTYLLDFGLDPTYFEARFKFIFEVGSRIFMNNVYQSCIKHEVVNQICSTC